MILPSILSSQHRDFLPSSANRSLLRCEFVAARSGSDPSVGETGEMAGVEVSVSPTKKRKAESSAEEESSPRATKRIQLPDGEKGAAGDGGDVAAPAKKKMWLLPQEEVDWILAQSTEPVCTEFRELKRANPSLVPSPEEEKDESTMLLYACVRSCYEDEAKYAKFQAWVRDEYARRGFVEVDFDYFAEKAESIRLSDEAREEALGHWDHPSEDDDEDWKLFIRAARRSKMERSSSLHDTAIREADNCCSSSSEVHAINMNKTCMLG